MEIKTYVGFIEMVTSNISIEDPMVFGNKYMVEETSWMEDRNGNGGSSYSTNVDGVNVYDIHTEKLIAERVRGGFLDRKGDECSHDTLVKSKSDNEDNQWTCRDCLKALTKNIGFDER